MEKACVFASFRASACWVMDEDEDEDEHTVSLRDGKNRTEQRCLEMVISRVIHSNHNIGSAVASPALVNPSTNRYLTVA